MIINEVEAKIAIWIFYALVYQVCNGIFSFLKQSFELT